jgi:hypothetical protein
VRYLPFWRLVAHLVKWLPFFPEGHSLRVRLRPKARYQGQCLGLAAVAAAVYGKRLNRAAAIVQGLDCDLFGGGIVVNLVEVWNRDRIEFPVDRKNNSALRISTMRAIGSDVRLTLRIGRIADVT